MSNDQLTNKEVDKVFLLYEKYQGNLPEFIRVLWKDAYEYGDRDGYVRGYNEGKVAGLEGRRF